MKKHIFFWLSILIPVALFTLPVIFLLLYSFTDDWKWMYFAFGSGVIAIVSWKPLAEWRYRARDMAQTDEFGNSTRKQYSKLSQKERDQIDLQKTADMERIVSTTTLKKMTQPGSTDPHKDLELLIGLKDVKQKVEEMAAKMEFDQQEKKKKGKQYKSPFDSGHHAVYFGPPGTGKAQPLYSKVLTPAGFVSMGDIKVGDKVISGTNQISTVLGVYPQGKKPIYALTLEGGATCRCSDEHLWNIKTRHGDETTVELNVILQCADLSTVYIPQFNDTTKEIEWKAITHIQYIGEEECQCIYIDDPSHLYITDNYIITHNTTVARIMTGFLYKYGYIKENKCVEVDGNFLKAGTETATKTTMVIRQAMGGVLFVDEAYALIQGDQYGQDAIATLIKQMEDFRGRFVLILAGYTNEMRELLNANPGFQSRLKEYLYFEEYNDYDMLTIFRTMAQHKGYTVSEGAEQNVLERIQAERQLSSFGNARTARSILDEAIEKHAYHCIKFKLPDDQRYVINAEDVSTAPRSI